MKTFKIVIPGEYSGEVTASIMKKDGNHILLLNDQNEIVAKAPMNALVIDQSAVKENPLISRLRSRKGDKSLKPDDDSEDWIDKL